MRILIVNPSIIPAHKYGGTERVIWYLGKELVKAGHHVTYLVNQGSECPFADVIFIEPGKPLYQQTGGDWDVVHWNVQPDGDTAFPTVVTMHGNPHPDEKLHVNTVFVSANHAERHGSQCFVHNGLDWDDYGPISPEIGNYHHFLGNAAWRVKNVKGAIETIRKVPAGRLKVIGGNRLNLKMGFRFTPYLNVQFLGMIGGEQKLNVLRHSRGLVFPVRWHEPFGLAIIESLYYGCPVFGTPYGSLPELVTADCGILADNTSELANSIKNDHFNRSICHQRAVDLFHSKAMAMKYLKLYERVANGHQLNENQPQTLSPYPPKFLPWTD
jgi:glycosyltransferase involved in cell wall biosynthesis